MKRLVSLMLLAVLLAVPACAAVPGHGIQGIFWDKLKARLQNVVPAVETPADQKKDTLGRDASDDLYWKGGGEPTRVPDAELAAFNLALQDVFDGNREDAVKGFEEFLSRYPGSALAGEARAALDELARGAQK